jgi:hypothetical protein
MNLNPKEYSMNRFLSQRPFALFLAAVAVGLLALARPAHAAERPHISRGTAQFTSDTTFVGTGLATHLGAYTESGTIQLIPTANPAVFDANATSIYTAPNGDELHATFTGQLNFQTGVVTATVTYVGGTGRFANATGTATLSGQLLPGGAIDVSVQGALNY